MTAKAIASVVLAAMLLGITAAPAAADDLIDGSGSTFAAIMLDQWRADAAQRFGLRVNYTANGSAAGRKQFAEQAVDFASSDISYLADDPQPGFPYAYMPLVAGGTAVMFNLRDGAGRVIDGLRLTGDVIARIFTMQITRWRDPAILGLNADNGVGERLPDIAIRPVVRAEGSGTTAVFMQYMAATAPDVMQALRDRFPRDYRTPPGVPWTDIYPGTPQVSGDSLPVTRANGSYALANIVANANSVGAIGYAEAGYALSAGLPMAFVQNTAGNFTLPTARNVAVALLEATRHGDGTQNLTAVFTNGRPEAYAISSYNYAIVPTAENSRFGTGKGATLGKYLTYALQEGQSKAAVLGYSPLPPNLVQQGFDVIRQIPGAPDPGPLGDWGSYYLSLEVGRIQRPGAGGVQGPAGGGGQGGGAAGGRGGGGPAGSAATTATTAAASSTTASTTGDAIIDELAAGDLSRGSRESLTGKYVMRDGKLYLIDEEGNEILVGLPEDRGVGIYLLLAGALLAVAILPPLAIGTIGPRRRRRRAEEAAG